MYKTMVETAKELSETQVSLLLLLSNGYKVVTNEGRNLKVWLEKDGAKVPYPIRKDTANHLASNQLMKLQKERSLRFRFEISDKGQKVLTNVETSRLNRCMYRLTSKGFKGIVC